MTLSVPVFVLDSFALIALFRDERAAGVVEEMINRGRRGEVRLAMTVVDQAEVYYKTVREHGVDRAEAVLAHMQRFAIDVIEVDSELALAAARIKGFHRISYADCLAAALAQRLDATLVTGDPDFRQVDSLVKIEWLPSV